MDNGIQVRQAFTLNRPADELYSFWRRFTEFPLFMRHVESVTEVDAKRSHWVVRTPPAGTTEWDAEIVEERVGEVIAWRTVGDSDVRHGGRVEFRPATGGRGTVVDVHLSYELPDAPPAAALTRLFSSALEAGIREDLRRFKWLAEAGEIPTIEGQSSGREPGPAARSLEKSVEVAS